MQPPAPAPPKGYRPHVSLKTKLEAILIHGPVFDDDGNRVCKIDELDFDHQPPLQLRIWDEEKQDTEPAANDPRYLVPMARATHRRKTAKTDVPAIAKTKRLAAGHKEFVSKLLARECGEKRTPKGKLRSSNRLRKRNAKSTQT